MLTVTSIHCPQNGAMCQRSACLQGLKCVLGNPADPVSVAVHAGWQCPVCKKGNAPWVPTCQNATCGIDLTRPTC